MAHAASQLKKNRDLEINAEEETEKKKKHRKRSRDRKKKVVAMCATGLSSLCLDFLPASETSMEGFFFSRAAWSGNWEWRWGAAGKAWSQAGLGPGTASS